MIIIDRKLQELEKTGKPIRVGLIGAGFAAAGVACQLLRPAPGMRLAGIANRTVENARQLLADGGAKAPAEPETGDKALQAIERGQVVITPDFRLLTECPAIDVIVDATGEVEYGAEVAFSAIKHRKHLVLINAELDATVGPILKKYADEAGVVYTQADGDQPAVLMNLMREVEFLGLKVVLAGNIKSLLDHYRTPDTQRKWAEEHYQRPKHVTNFADGTKIAMEMATVANATGFRVAKRGMLGLPTSHAEGAAKLFQEHLPKDGGLVDYILGAEPSFGVFVLGTTQNPMLQRYLQVYKMGNGPLYTFYRPHHLSPLEAPLSIARAALFGDGALVPKDALTCEVITLAKKDMKRGDTLDGMGGFTGYGMLENYDTALEGNLLPIGLSEGCVLKRDIPKDAVITYADVQMPRERLCDTLRAEQDSRSQAASVKSNAAGD